jgi:hypothetical protein
VLVTPSRLARLLLGASLFVACSEPGSDDSPAGTSTGPQDDTDTSSAFDSQPADQCVAAPLVRTGRHTGSLRGKTSDRNGACDRGGPDAFVLLDVPRRADVNLLARGVGFVPVVGARSPRCELGWSSTQHLCTQGLEGWVLDLPAGSTLLVSVGIDPGDPALASAPTPGLADPLDFVLDLELRNVLLEGEPCVPASRGRCVSGTACLAVDSHETGGTAETPRCVAVAGDTCATAISVDLESGTTVLEIDRDDVQTDAHEHGCGGARRPERVLVLGLPPDLEPGAHLEVRAHAPDILLALRGPGCAADEELACAPDSADGSVAIIEDLLAVGSPNVFLFIEYPRPAHDDESTTSGGTDGDETTDSGTGELPPLIVEIELSGA